MNKEKLREILIKLVEPFAYPMDVNWKERVNPTLAIANAEAAILELMPRWIPVTERLPDEDVWVLATEGNSAEPPLVMRRWNPRDGMGWFWQIWTMDGIYSAYSVTLWHPLPEPPRGEDDAA